MSTTKKTLTHISLVTVGAAAAYLAINGTALDLFAQQEPEPKVQLDSRPVERSEKLTTSFAPMVKRVAPSVVNIYTTRMVDNPLLNNPMFDDPVLRQFFEDQFQQQENLPEKQKEQGLGSGVIVSEDGYILTSAHVIEAADEIKVSLAGSREELSAEIVGKDIKTDIAVLRVDKKNLPAISLADSDQLQVGDVVLAIGNPFGVGQTVTMGIVSATGRGNFNILDYEDFIQTDAAINLGNSGGALVDAEGRLVGINTFIISRSGANAGLGFAVPINLARQVMNQLVTEGKVVRGYLGVYPQDLSPRLAKMFEIETIEGALVGGVLPGSPADDAGIEPGDVLVEFNGKKVSTSRDLRLTASQTPPGTEVQVKLLRKGDEKSISLTLGELPTELAQTEVQTESKPKFNPLQGVELSELTPRLRRQFNIPEDVRGAIVTSVAAGSAAQEGGLRAGDVIISIRHEEVNSPASVLELATEAEGEDILFRVWGGGGSRYVVVEIPGEEP